MIFLGGWWIGKTPYAVSHLHQHITGLVFPSTSASDENVERMRVKTMKVEKCPV